MWDYFGLFTNGSDQINTKTSDLKTGEEVTEDFQATTLHELARHYTREALLEQEARNPWIESFKSTEPNFQGAREAYFADGSECIKDFESYAKLVRLASANSRMTRTLGPLYASFMAQWLREHTAFVNHMSGSVEKGRENWITNSKTTVNKLWFPGDSPEDSDGSGSGTENPFRVEARRIYDVTQEARFRQSEYRKRDIARTVWRELEDRIKAGDVSGDHQLKLNSPIETALHRMMSSYHLYYLQEEWLLYVSNLKAFVYHMGCAQAHDDVDKIIAELRVFLANSMPFIAKLQKNLQDQIEINRKQQEMITALTFRHLFENLPPSSRYPQRDASSKWKAFWMDMVIKEVHNKNGTVAITGHPLEGLVDDTRIAIPNPRDTSKDIITHASAAGQKGSIWRAGDEMYSTLSTNIHKYKADGRDAYIVKSDQFGQLNRDVLNALTKIDFNDEGGMRDTDEENKILGPP